MNLTIGVLPAAGSATRMNGIPKFLLPTRHDGRSLLERHVDQLGELVDQIWIPTRPEFVHLISSLNLGPRVVVVGMNTKTMSETVLRVAGFCQGDKFLLGLPDSYIHGVNPYAGLVDSKLNLKLAGFKIRTDQQGKLGQFDLLEDTVIDVVDKSFDCKYEQAWGAISFSQEFVKLIRPDESHVGIAFPRALKLFQVGANVTNAGYFDCGTPSEYFMMLQETL